MDRKMECAYCENETNVIHKVLIPCFHFVCDDCCDFKNDRCPKCLKMIVSFDNIDDYIEKEIKYNEVYEDIMKSKLVNNKKQNAKIHDEIKEINDEEKEEERRLLEEYNKKVVLLKRKNNLLINEFKLKLSDNLRKKQTLQSMDDFLSYCKSKDRSINMAFFDLLKATEE